MLIWQACCSSPEAKTPRWWISARSRAACPCLRISRSVAKTRDLGRQRSDGPDGAVGSQGRRGRVVGATPQAKAKKSRGGVTGAGLVSELFFPALPEARGSGGRGGCPRLASWR